MFVIAAESLYWEFKDPDRGDTQDRDEHMRAERTRFGVMKTSRPSVRNTVRIDTMTFNVFNDCHNRLIELVAFFEAIQGLLLTITWNSLNYHAVLMPEEIEFVTVSDEHITFTVKLMVLP